MPADTTTIPGSLSEKHLRGLVKTHVKCIHREVVRKIHLHGKAGYDLPLNEDAVRALLPMPIDVARSLNRYVTYDRLIELLEKWERKGSIRFHMEPNEHPAFASLPGYRVIHPGKERY